MIGGCRPSGIPLSTAMNIVNIPSSAMSGQTVFAGMISNPEVAGFDVVGCTLMPA